MPSRHVGSRTLIAAVGCRVHVAVGVIEIKPVVLVRHQVRAQAQNTAVIDVIQGAASSGRGARIVRVVMPLQVVIGA